MLSLKVGELIKGDEPLISYECSLREAFEKMREKGRGYILLMREKYPAGILTERDLIRLIGQGVSFEERAIDYASKRLIHVRDYRDLYYALSLMVENNIRRLVVVDKDSNFLGTLTMEEVLGHAEEDIFKKRIKVREILLDREFVWVSPETTLSECLKLMKEKSIGALPVLKEGIPVGVITERDIVKLFDRINLSAPVELYMSKPVITINEDALAELALRIMEENRIRRLVVVDDRGFAVGIISNRDIAKNAYESYWKFLETKLRHAKDVLNLLPEPTFELIDLFSSQVIVWMNAKAIELFGGLIDHDITEVIPAKDWSYIYSTLLRDRRVERQRFNIGDKAYELSASYLFVETEKVKGRIKLMLRDITQDLHSQRIMERELNNYMRIMNSTEDMIIVYESDSGKIKFVNRAAIRKLGYTEEELKNMTIFQIVDADPEFIRQNIQRIVRKDEVIRGRRFYKDSYGNRLPVDITATKVHMNSVPYILIVARDISDRLKLEEEIERKTQELESLHDFILNLNRCSSEGEAHNLLAHMLVKIAGVDALAIYRINPSLNRVVDKLFYGSMEYAECLEEGEEPSACKVFQSAQPFLVRDKKAYSCPLFKSGYGSYLCMSVVSGGKTIAMLSMISQKEDFFNRRKLDFIENIVNTFAPFLSNLRLIEINKELSIRDPLTNLYNRRFIAEFLHKKIEEAKRNHSQLALLLLDLDHFKKINDTHGHHVGDLCLKALSDVLRDVVRSMDVVGRWGGEEFVVILPATGRLEAVQVANRIREGLKKKLVYSDKGIPVSMTASIGIAVFPEDGETVDDLFKVADDKLYLAKNEGRDMVIP